ncbi:MAG: cytochrome P450 [Sandaracinaceae bacterium]|nr:cytochrome P450 [Sandaracinaceae bacterium]
MSVPQAVPTRVHRMSFAQFAMRAPGLLGDRAEAIRRIALDYGDLVEMPIPGKHIHIVTSPELARHVLQHNNKNYRRSFDFRIMQTFLGDGLITTHDEFWQHARRAAMPAFRQRFVESLTDAIAFETSEYFDEALGNDQSTRLTHAAMSVLSLRLFASTMLSVNVRNEEGRFLKAMQVAVRHLDRRLAAVVDTDAFMPTLSKRRFHKATAEIDEILATWMRTRLSHPGEKDDLMALLLRASADIEESKRSSWLRDQVLTSLAAGHETVAVALAWCLLMLATHQAVQDRVRAETLGKVGARGVLRESVPTLAYTDAVVCETLRLYPSVWSIGREALGEDRFGDAVIPAGATVMVCPYAIHRRPDLWADADQFIPDRFLAGPPARPFQYLPFSGGPRHCIGDHLSMLELKIVIATLVSRYRIERVDNRRVGKEPLVSLRPHPDFELRFTPIPRPT